MVDTKHQAPPDQLVGGEGQDVIIEGEQQVPQPQEKEEVSESTTNVTTSGSSSSHNNDEKADLKPHAGAEEGDLPPMQQLTVEELYDKDKYDLSTMEPGDVFVLLQ